MIELELQVLINDFVVLGKLDVLYDLGRLSLVEVVGLRLDALVVAERLVLVFLHAAGLLVIFGVVKALLVRLDLQIRLGVHAHLILTKLVEVLRFITLPDVGRFENALLVVLDVVGLRNLGH